MNEFRGPSLPKVSRRRATLIYLFFNYLNLALLIVQGVVLVPTYLRYIDVAVYGAWLATGNVVSYLGVLDLGLSAVTMQRVAHAHGASDILSLGRVIATGSWLIRRLSFLPLVVGLVLAPLVPRFVGIGGADAASLSWCFVAASLSTSLMFLTYFAASVLVGLQRQLMSGIVSFVGASSGIVFTLWGLHRGLGVLAIPLGLLLRAGILALGTVGWMWVILRRLIPRGSSSRDPAETKTLLRSSLNVFAANACSVLAMQSDALIVAIARDPGLAARFTITRKAVDLICLFATHIANCVLPALAHLRGTGDAKRMQRFSSLSLKVSSSVALVGLGGVFLLNHSFVRLWVGEGLWGGNGLTALFCVGGLLQVLATALSSLLVAFGDIVKASRTRIWEAALRVPLALILGSQLGMLGVAIAALLAALPTTIALQARQLAGHFELTLGRSLAGALRFWALVGLPTAALWAGMTISGELRPILNFFVYGAIQVIACAATLLMFDRDLRSLVGEFVARAITGGAEERRGRRARHRRHGSHGCP